MPRPSSASTDHPGLASRLAAAAVLTDVLLKGRPLDEHFSEILTPKRDPRDQALTRSIATVALRRLGTIRKTLAQFIERGLPKRAGNTEWHLVVAMAQILFMDVPDHAAVDLGVRAVRSGADSMHFAALANAVLRNTVRGRDAILADSDPLADDTPGWLAKRWIRHYGADAAYAIAKAHQAEPTLDLTVKADPDAWAEKLGGLVLPTGSVRLATHQAVRDLEGYADGAWWVQDAAAAIVGRLVCARAGESIADLCAAPGGKTALLASSGAKVTSIDKSAERLKRLGLNLERLHLEADVAASDALTYRGGPFDAVLLDAPCSATGTIRRHPDVAWSKSEANIATLATLQGRLLDQASQLLRPGGRLIYCVCSLEPEEGEAQVAAFLRRSRAFTRDPIRAEEIGNLVDCVSAAGDLRTLPFHLPAAEPRFSGLDGFFAARLVFHG